MKKTWTIKTIRDGEAVRVDEGVSSIDAVTAIYRAMHGQDPVGDRIDAVKGERAPVAEPALAA